MIKYYVIIFIVICQLGFTNSSNNIEFINQHNNDNALLVMISGYKGARDWQEFKKLIIDDDSLKQYDILIYGLEKDMGINDNVKKIKKTLNDGYSKYQEYILISFSLGGIVTKQYVLNQLRGSDKHYSKISYVIFIGTPHIKDKFTVSFFKSAAALFTKPFLNQLLKDASENKQLSKINAGWIQKIEKNKENYIGNITIFGRDDGYVKPEELDNHFQGEYRVISGTHRQLVKDLDKNHCSFKIVRSKLLNKQTKISQVSCINP